MLIHWELHAYFLRFSPLRATYESFLYLWKAPSHMSKPLVPNLVFF